MVPDLYDYRRPGYAVAKDTLNEKQKYVRVVQLLNELENSSVQCLILSLIASQINYLTDDDHEDQEDREDSIDFLRAIEWMLWCSSVEHEWIPNRKERVSILDQKE